MAHAFFLGVDARSESGEPVAVAHALLDKSKEVSDEPSTYRLNDIRTYDDVPSPAEFAEHIQGLVAKRPYIGRTTIVVNRADAHGDAVFDALEDLGLAPVGAALTEGAPGPPTDRDEMGVRVSGVDAVRTLADLYLDDRFAIESNASETGSRLARDVQALAERVDEAEGDARALGTVTAGPSFDPAAIHVNSAALAAWLATERSFDPSQHLKESPQTDGSSR